MSLPPSLPPSLSSSLLPQGHGQGAKSQSGRQKKELKKKLEKTKTQLVQEKEHFHEAQTSYLHEMETTTSEKAQQRWVWSPPLPPR